MSPAPFATPSAFASLISIGVGGLVKGVLGQFAGWVSDGAAGILNGLGNALTSTTAAPLNQEFVAVYVLVRNAGAAMAATFLMLAVLRAIVRQDLADLWRIVLIRLPLALLGAGIALQLVELAMQASDALSSSLLGSTSPSASSFPASLALLLQTVGGAPNGGFDLLVLALVSSFVGFVLWVELVIRSSAIAIATLFIPLALTGAIWSSTVTWARRLAEILAALIFSKIVVVGVFTLAIVELGGPSGLNGLVQGVSLLLLATFAPWSLLRLVPVVESGFVAHLDGLASRVTRAVGGSAGAGMDLFEAPGADFVPTPSPTTPQFDGLSFDTPEFRALVAQQEEHINTAIASAAAAKDVGGSESLAAGDAE